MESAVAKSDYKPSEHTSDATIEQVDRTGRNGKASALRGLVRCRPLDTADFNASRTSVITVPLLTRLYRRIRVESLHFSKFDFKMLNSRAKRESLWTILATLDVHTLDITVDSTEYDASLFDVINFVRPRESFIHTRGDYPIDLELLKNLKPSEKLHVLLNRPFEVNHYCAFDHSVLGAIGITTDGINFSSENHDIQIEVCVPGCEVIVLFDRTRIHYSIFDDFVYIKILSEIYS